MNILIIITVIALILSKYFDVNSTIKNIGVENTESNPIANRIINRFGIKKGIYFIFGIAIVIILACGIFVYYTQSVLYKLFFIIIGVLITLIQIFVALSNSRNEHIFIAKYVYKFHLIMDNISKKSKK